MSSSPVALVRVTFACIEFYFACIEFYFACMEFCFASLREDFLPAADLPGSQGLSIHLHCHGSPDQSRPGQPATLADLLVEGRAVRLVAELASVGEVGKDYGPWPSEVEPVWQVVSTRLQGGRGSPHQVIPHPAATEARLPRAGGEREP